MREDPDSFNNADDWFDDTSGVPVTAEITVDGRRIPVEGACVVVAPPNYAPDVVGWRTMTDLLTDLCVENGWLCPPRAPCAFCRRVARSAASVQPTVGGIGARAITAREQPPARLFLEAKSDGWWYVGASLQRRTSAVAIVDRVDARGLRCQEHFVTRLGALPNLGHVAGAASDWSVLQVSPAGGAWLDTVHRQGWIACGDAALTFDPLSSPGLIGALASGVAAARAISGNNPSAALVDMDARHADILAIYEARGPPLMPVTADGYSDRFVPRRTAGAHQTQRALTAQPSIPISQ